jgi:hypothetical protein
MDAFLSQDPTPDDSAEVQTYLSSMKVLGEGCLDRTGPLLAHISTEDTARDMDIFTFISTDHPTVDSLVDSA